MLLWFSFAILSAAVLAVVLRPMWSAAPDASRASASIVYRDQLTELDNELKRGLIGPAEADAARTEIARRLLAEAESDEARTARATHPSLTRLSTAVAVVAPLCAIGIYLAVGSPWASDQPLSARFAPTPESAQIAKLVMAVEERLRLRPDDGQGWDVIAPVYLRQGRYGKAADAYAQASRLLGETPKRLAGFAEATVLGNEGVVTEPARAAFEKLTRLAPDEIEPRFWLAVADQQAGRRVEAASAFRALMTHPAVSTSWKQLLTEHLESLRAQDPSAPPSTAARLGEGARSPTPADVSAAAQMNPDDRQRMIEDMVQGLATRLETAPRDLAGWQRLIRAHAVLGRRDAALEALKTARSTFVGEPEPLSALGDLARSLGLDT